ncbi:hypothetical protein [Streptomyces sp. NPDC058371]|uniref:hypothetical protein n=1 Tax=Streptomyces sp. NPDC058371 TaxID=3346463 RepID=UPI003667B85B
MTAHVPFDGTAYRRQVLAILQTQTPLSLDDPFLLAALDPAESLQDDAVQQHLAQVKAFLQRERDSAKYKPVATELIRQWDEWAPLLLDGKKREGARKRAQERKDAGYREVDEALAKVVKEFGGIPRSRESKLWRLAERLDMPESAFRARLARHPTVEDGGGVEPLPAEVRRQIRSQLDELGRLRGDRLGTATLWAFLKVPANAGQEQIREALDTLAGNHVGGYNRQTTVTNNLLTQVRNQLLGRDPAAYTAGLFEDARDALRPQVKKSGDVSDTLEPADVEGLVQEVTRLAYGLSLDRARQVVLSLAGEAGLGVSTGMPVEYVLCPECRAVAPADGPRTCRYCRAALYTPCPSCGRETEAAPVTCNHCGYDLRAAHETAAVLRRACEALAAARPLEAARYAGEARERAEALPQGLDLDPAEAGSCGEPADVERRALAAVRAANAEWRALESDISLRRIYQAAERARHLVATGSDVSGPDGATPAARLDALTARRDAMRERAAEARTLPPGQQEQALLVILAEVADCREAIVALARFPLAPPTALTAAEEGDGVRLTWRPSPAKGTVEYRVSRVVTDRRTRTTRQHTLGRTQRTQFEDSTAPVGEIVSYEVLAAFGERRSPPVTSPPRLVAHDVRDLRAEPIPRAVRLSWRIGSDPHSSYNVVINRVVESSSPISRPLRRIHGSGGEAFDRHVETGVTYRYRVFAEYTDEHGRQITTPGQEVTVTATG